MEELYLKKIELEDKEKFVDFIKELVIYGSQRDGGEQGQTTGTWEGTWSFQNFLCDLQTVKEREQSLVQCHGEKGLPDP